MRVCECDAWCVAANIRLTERCVLAMCRRSPGARPSAATVLSFWFMTMAHELAHNGCSPHNRKFANLCEAIAAERMPRLVDLLGDDDAVADVRALCSAAVAALDVM